MVHSQSEIDGDFGIYILGIGGLIQLCQLKIMQDIGVVPLSPIGDRRFL